MVFSDGPVPKNPVGVGISGAGRIGILTYKAMLPYEEKGIIKVIAFNDIDKNATPEAVARYMKRDSAHGRFPALIEHDESNVIVNGRKIAILHEKEPSKIGWGARDVSIVLEATGAFTFAKDPAKGVGYMDHVDAGAKYVVISAPVKDNVAKTVVRGVNYTPELLDMFQAISNASCTTNCLAPIVKVLDFYFGIVAGDMITVHAYTNDQKLVDAYHKDSYRSRAAAQSIIPTSTGAAKAIGLIFPHMKGRISENAIAYRVPVLDGSVVDFTVKLDKKTTPEEVNEKLEQVSRTPFSQGGLEGIMEFEHEKGFVSADVIDNPHSSVVNGPSTTTASEGRIKIVSWYDNEWGYSNRTAELILSIAEKLRQ